MAAEESVAGVGEEETILYPQPGRYAIIITLATGKKRRASPPVEGIAARMGNVVHDEGDEQHDAGSGKAGNQRVPVAELTDAFAAGHGDEGRGASGRMERLKEFGCNLERYDPYADGPAPRLPAAAALPLW